MSGTAVISNSMIPHSEIVSILTAEVLTPAEVAAVLKVSRKALADWRLKREGPPFYLRSRGKAVYPAESFKTFLRASGAGKSPVCHRRALVKKLLATVENK